MINWYQNSRFIFCHSTNWLIQWLIISIKCISEQNVYLRWQRCCGRLYLCQVWLHMMCYAPYVKYGPNGSHRHNCSFIYIKTISNKCQNISLINLHYPHLYTKWHHVESRLSDGEIQSAQRLSVNIVLVTAGSLEINFLSWLANWQLKDLWCHCSFKHLIHCIYCTIYLLWLFVFYSILYGLYHVGTKRNPVNTLLYYLCLPEPAQRIFSSIFSTHFCQWSKGTCGIKKTLIWTLYRD